MVNLRAALKTGRVVWERIIRNPDVIPTDMQVWIPQMMSAMGVAEGGFVKPCIGPPSSQETYAHLCEHTVVSPPELIWQQSVWKTVKGWPVTSRDMFRRLFFRVLPCDEFMWSWARDRKEIKCPFCGAPTLMGPTHLLHGCKRVWPHSGDEPGITLSTKAGWHSDLAQWVQIASGPQIKGCLAICREVLQTRTKRPSMAVTRSTKRQKAQPSRGAATDSRKNAKGSRQKPIIALNADPIDENFITITHPSPAATAVIRRPERSLVDVLRARFGPTVESAPKRRKYQ